MTSFREPSKMQVTERDKSIYIYMYKIGAFFCFPQLTYQRMLISYKVPVRMYNVKPDKISRIMYLIMFWSVTSRSSNEKWAIAWENLSFGIGFTVKASGSIIRMRGSRGPDPHLWKFTKSILSFAPPPWKNLDPLPCKMLDPLWNLKNIVFLKINHWFPSVKR